MLDYSEPSSRVFLFDNILLLVVPTAAIYSSKRMIPLETIKRDMTTLGIITKNLFSSLPYRSLNRGTKRTRCVPFFHTAMHKCHVPFCLYFVNIVILYTPVLHLSHMHHARILFWSPLFVKPTEGSYHLLKYIRRSLCYPKMLYLRKRQFLGFPYS